MRRNNQITAAYKLAEQVRRELPKVARCMEVIEDKCGIVVERYHLLDPPHTNLVLFATPHWYDLFVPLTRADTHQEVVDALHKLTNP